MAVSLKKSTESAKVDLSKPAVHKLPECTPVHLMDEEETIKPHLVEQKRWDPLPIEQIRLHHSELEEREIWDLWDKYCRRYKIKRIIVIVALVVLVLAVLSVVIAFAVNSDDFKEAFSSLCDEVVVPLFDLFDGNPLFLLIGSILAIVSLVSVVRNISHINRF